MLYSGPFLRYLLLTIKGTWGAGDAPRAGRQAVRVGLFTLAAALAVASFAIADVRAREQGPAPFNPARDCIRPLYPIAVDDPFQNVLAGDPRLDNIAQQCGAWANDARHGGVDAVRARFHAGRANRMSNNLEVAVPQLEGAAAVGATFSNFRPEERRVATLELIHAYWQANRLDDAQARLDDGLNRSRVLSSGDAAVAYQQAMLLLARSGLPARKEAFNTLQTWFPGDQAALRSAGLSDEDIQSARSWLFRLGVDLGRETLADASDVTQRMSDARDGIAYFGAAARTVEVGCPRPRTPQDACTGVRQPQTPATGIDNSQPQRNLADEIEYAFFGLGVSHLRAAGVADADAAHLADPGGLDCLGGQLQPDAAPHINEAGRAFESIQYYYPNPAPARWGLGCTLLAAPGNGPMSAQQLQAAINLLSNPRPTTVNMLLTLAHAQVMQNNRSDARANLSQALNMPGVDDDLRGKIQVDIARTYYYQSNSGQRADPDLFTRAISDVEGARLNDLQQPAVNTALQQAARGDNAEAELVLANIALRQGNYDGACGRLRDIVRANLVADRRVGVGPYLLSRCLTVREQADLASGKRRAPRAVPGAEAVSRAVDAFRLQNAHAPQYRRQACAAQITFGDIFRSQEYCDAGANPDPQALLFQGMYWLRRGIAERRGIREGSLTRAMQAFVQGNDVSGGSNYDFLDLRNNQSEPISLTSLHRYGATFVQVCVGLDFVNQGDETARQVFLQSGIPTC